VSYFGLDSVVFCCLGGSVFCFLVGWLGFAGGVFRWRGGGGVVYQILFNCFLRRQKRQRGGDLPKVDAGEKGLFIRPRKTVDEEVSTDRSLVRSGRQKKPGPVEDLLAEDKTGERGITHMRGRRNAEADNRCRKDKTLI